MNELKTIDSSSTVRANLLQEIQVSFIIFFCWFSNLCLVFKIN